jgi:hypothetical protein
MSWKDKSMPSVQQDSCPSTVVVRLRFLKHIHNSNLPAPEFRAPGLFSFMPSCERCQKPTNVTIMSMFNTQTICMDCKDSEKKHPKYKEAQQAELEAVKANNYNFQGIGFPGN